MTYRLEYTMPDPNNPGRRLQAEEGEYSSLDEARIHARAVAAQNGEPVTIFQLLNRDRLNVETVDTES